jgi:adenylate cyclase
MDRPAHTDPETLAAVVELGLREWSRPEHAVFSLAETVRDRGVPLARLHLGFDLQHPLVQTGLIDWDDVSGGRFEVVPWRGGDDRVRALESSPIWPIRTRETECVRVDLRDWTVADAFGVTRGLARAGFTDYVALALDVGAALPGAVTFATRHPDGFREAGMRVLATAAWGFQVVARGLRWRALSETLARTYVGPETGPRVLEGAIRRGDVTRREAVVWFSDLRGFTRLSTALEAGALVSVLNDVFEVVGAHVVGAGGEILKFIGDAVLAIFPYGTEAEAADACTRATGAALGCLAALEASGDARVGIGLHRGELIHGNIGTPDRLDFTVVGRTVNLASRVEGLCGALEEPLLATAAVAEQAAFRRRTVGVHTVKGVAELVEVFALEA